MGFEGIGASVRRKEDLRFLNGHGHYTDDINRPGQLHAFFKRSDRPHATIVGIDTAAAAKAPGVVAVFTGADMAAEDRRPALRLADPQQGRLPDGRAAASGPRDRQGAPRRRSRRRGDRRNQQQAKTPPSCWRSTTPTFPPSPRVTDAVQPGAPRGA